MSYLRKVEGLLALGYSFEEIRRELGISEQQYHRWAMMAQERTLQKLKMENRHLKQTLAQVAPVGFKPSPAIEPTA